MTAPHSSTKACVGSSWAFGFTWITGTLTLSAIVAPPAPSLALGAPGLATGSSSWPYCIFSPVAFQLWSASFNAQPHSMTGVFAPPPTDAAVPASPLGVVVAPAGTEIMPPAASATPVSSARRRRRWCVDRPVRVIRTGPFLSFRHALVVPRRRGCRRHAHTALQGRTAHGVQVQSTQCGYRDDQSGYRAAPTGPIGHGSQHRTLEP